MTRTILIAVAVVAMIFGVVAYAGAATSTTAVQATVPSVLEITAPANVTITLGTYGASDISGTAPATITGKSNKLATMSAVVTEGDFDTLGSTLETPVANLRGGNISQSDTISAAEAYTTDEATVLTGSILYQLL
jgi:threonine dehydrogenase-like Zn-dependent dehydrogenase